MAINNKVTLAMVKARQDETHELVKVLASKMEQHLIIDHKAVEMDVDRLKQVEKSRQWHIRTIWAAMVAALVGIFFK